jgi:hypothetical protein
MAHPFSWCTTSSSSASPPHASCMKPAPSHRTSSRRLSQRLTRHCGESSRNRCVTSPTQDGPRCHSLSVNKVAPLQTLAGSSGQPTQRAIWTQPQHGLCSATIRTPLLSLNPFPSRTRTLSQAMSSATNPSNILSNKGKTQSSISCAADKVHCAGIRPPPIAPGTHAGMMRHTSACLRFAILFKVSERRIGAKQCLRIH